MKVFGGHETKGRALPDFGLARRIAHLIAPQTIPTRDTSSPVLRNEAPHVVRIPDDSLPAETPDQPAQTRESFLRTLLLRQNDFHQPIQLNADELLHA